MHLWLRCERSTQPFPLDGQKVVLMFHNFRIVLCVSIGRCVSLVLCVSVASCVTTVLCVSVVCVLV